MKQSDHDTIFASSSQFRSVIKIIRITGSKAKRVSSIFSFKQPAPRIFTLTNLTYKNTVIDKAPVIWLPRKRSFTGEDTYEIYIHGSIVIENLIYRVLSSYKGFRPAEAGEFTKRAVINGNIDLIQAESINEIINAQTERQLTIAQSQLDGSLSKVINNWRKEIIHISSLIESLIDFSDEDIPQEVTSIFYQKIVYLLFQDNNCS